MPDGFIAEEQETAASGSAAMVLQIARPDNQPPLQFPAMVRNLSGGVVTLEVNNPWTILNWDALKGNEACLRLLSAAGELTEQKGTISWARYSVQDQTGGKLSLGLKLYEFDLASHRSISGQIEHTSKDIIGLWDRWEEAQHTAAPESPPYNPRILAGAVGLLLAGLGLQLAAPKGVKFFGWLLWFFGTLAIATQTLRYWKSRKISR
jgi:hypothetical protein